MNICFFPFQGQPRYCHCRRLWHPRFGFWQNAVASEAAIPAAAEVRWSRPPGGLELEGAALFFCEFSFRVSAEKPSPPPHTKKRASKKRERPPLKKNKLKREREKERERERDLNVCSLEIVGQFGHKITWVLLGERAGSCEFLWLCPGGGGGEKVLRSSFLLCGLREVLKQGCGPEAVPRALVGGVPGAVPEKIAAKLIFAVFYRDWDPFEFTGGPVPALALGQHVKMRGFEGRSLVRTDS